MKLHANARLSVKGRELHIDRAKEEKVAFIFDRAPFEAARRQAS